MAVGAMKLGTEGVVRGSGSAFVAAMALLLPSCGGGGSSSGASVPQTYVSFAQPSASVDEGAAPLAVQVMLHTSLAATTEDTYVEVYDVGSGTATVAADYAVFGTQAVTFPAGSTNGDTQTLSLTAVDDMSVEGGSETVRFGLKNVTGGAIYGTSAFTATIQDIHRATIQFASPASTTPDETAVPRSVSVVLVLQTGVTLAAAAGVRVVDAGSGSASSGVDYAAFAPTTVTFQAGSVNGASRTVTVNVINDAIVETNETIWFGLNSPMPCTDIGAPNTHQLTITDDDASGAALISASEGPNGTENSLAYDVTVALGSQTIGAGPNTGTRIRISNSGGAPLELGAPRLTGSDANDFDVEIESAPMPPANMSLPPGPDTLSPLLAAEHTPGPGLAVQLDLGQLSLVNTLERTTLVGFPVPGIGEVALELEQVPLPITSDAVLKVDGVPQPGGLRGALLDLSIWTGSVRDRPNSRVFFALTAAGSRGFVDLGFGQDTIVHLLPDANATVAGLPAGSRVVREAEMAAMGLGQQPDVCSEAREVPGGGALLQGLSALGTPATAELTAADCRLAIETDYQLFQKFGTTLGVTNYVTQLIAAVSDQYFRDVQTRISIAYLGVYSNASDPWTSQDSGGNASNLLDEFRSAWAPNSWPVSANLAHFISGASLGGGIAYVNTLCSTSYGFGVSGNISGTINWLLWTGAPGNFTWDFVVVAHELGHNFGSSHTHAFCPPLDKCSSNCTGGTVCSRGTIMSYCHTCGGMSNIDLEFHPVCANIMRQAVNASCITRSALAGGDHVQYRVRFNPLTNPGVRNATLEFTHNAGNEPQPFRVKLQGTAN